MKQNISTAIIIVINVVLLALSACGDDDEPECVTHLSDCPTGEVCVEGKCRKSLIYTPCKDSPEICETEGLVCTNQYTSTDQYLKCQTPCKNDLDCPGTFDSTSWTNCLTCEGRPSYCNSPVISCE